MDKDEKDPREELRHLCQNFLNEENRYDLLELKKYCLEIYESLVLLQQQENNLSAEQVDIPKPNNTEHSEKPSMAKTYTEPAQEEKKPEQKEDQEYPTLSDLFVPTFDDIKVDMSQKEEFKDTVSLEETEKLFETKKEEPKQLSLNDRLVGNSIQVGLNDRIAFVNKLFNFSQSDFNKVLSTLNSFETKEEAFNYLQYQVKTTYNWKGKEDLEERFMILIERKFMV